MKIQSTEQHPIEPSNAPDTKTPSSVQVRRPGRHKKRVLSVLLVVVVLASVSMGAHIALMVLEDHPATVKAPPAEPTYVLANHLDPERQIARQVDHILSQMTLQEELGQLIVVAFNGTTLNSDLRYMLTQQHAGGVMLYAYNIAGYAQIQALDAAAQAQAQIPLFIATDQEGGLVNRLQSIVGPRPSALQIGNTNNPQNALNLGIEDGQVLHQIGVNVDLAPVVDVHSAPQTVIITRMYGTTPEKVTAFAGAYLDGLQSQGVIACLKHWPGLGASPVDPHDALPVITRSQQELNDIDFAPYRALISQGNVNMIMSTHELITAYDDQLPSSLSPIMIDQVLRNDLGYQGVVITDGLYMGALAHWSIAQAAVLALIAGNDLLLGPWNSYQVQQVLDALQAALASGQISKARIDQSVTRILTLKIKEGLIPVSPNW
jgi:beta-N-acetylhexosaminidase